VVLRRTHCAKSEIRDRAREDNHESQQDEYERRVADKKREHEPHHRDHRARERHGDQRTHRADVGRFDLPRVTITCSVRLHIVPDFFTRGATASHYVRYVLKGQSGSDRSVNAHPIGSGKRSTRCETPPSKPPPDGAAYMRTVEIIGAPTDYGANRRGVDMGPSAIRYGGLAAELEGAGVACIDGGDLAVPRAEERDPDTDQPRVGMAKFLRETADVCERLADRVEGALADGTVPLTLGGDHSIAIGSLVGAARGASIGAVWFDAHADLNTPETTPSGNVHGMPLAAALGIGAFEDVGWANAPGLAPENVALVGLRSVDDAERELIRERGFTAYTMSDIDERGITAVTEEALRIASDGVDGVHISLDLDWLDPNEAPGVGTPVRGGVTYREAHTAMEIVHEAGSLRSMELVEVNPTLDQHNETAELATELAASAFGKRVL